jgi:hypothetical protein
MRPKPGPCRPLGQRPSTIHSNPSAARISRTTTSKKADPSRRRMRFFPHVPKLTAKVVRKLFKLVTGRPEEITSLNVKFVGHSKIITVHCTKTRFWVEGYFQLSLIGRLKLPAIPQNLRGSKVISERQTRSSIQGCLKWHILEAIKNATLRPGS